MCCLGYGETPGSGDCYGAPATGPQPHAVKVVDNEIRFIYDENGNMTQRTDENGTVWALAWTPENMLHSATTGGDTITYAYDADGMMVQRTENGQTTNRLGKLFEHNVTLGSFKKHYLFGGKLVAMRDGLAGDTPVSFLASDHLGSTTLTVWANGTVRTEVRYDPWGQERWQRNTNPMPTGYRYTSQRWDSGLGLYDYNARYYDPHSGKFISADTLVPEQKRLTPLTVAFHENQFLEKVNQENGQITQFGPISSWDAQLKKEFGVPDGPLAPQNLNRLAYAANNPLVRVDPTGHESIFMTTTAELAQEAVNFLMGHSGEIGFTENLHHWGQAGVMISGTAAVGATPCWGAVFIWLLWLPLSP